MALRQPEVFEFSVGPQGAIVPTAWAWLDARTLELNFDVQKMSGEYKIVVGPQILDIAGNALDFDGDLIAG
jgi:hypothetical protein